MRLIDADALYETLCHLWDKSDSEDFEKGVFRIVITAPSIDIVRCRECKHWLNNSGLCKHWSKLYGSVLTKADDFCSYGERKESE